MLDQLFGYYKQNIVVDETYHHNVHKARKNKFQNQTILNSIHSTGLSSHDRIRVD